MKSCAIMVLASLLGSILSGGKVPSEDFLLGKWGCSDNVFVFMSGEGRTPDKSLTDAELVAMGATYSNCTLDFSRPQKLNFRVGDKSFDLDWSIDPSTMEFTTRIGHVFSIKGYIVRQGDRLVLIYSRPDLFMIMRFLCSRDGRKHITPMGKLLDCCEGLTIGMIFSKY